MISDIKNTKFGQFKMKVKNDELFIFNKDGDEWSQLKSNINLKPFMKDSEMKLKIHVDNELVEFNINLNCMEFKSIEKKGI
mgnify:CR=1 FL=1